jgi:hypothetical protein
MKTIVKIGLCLLISGSLLDVVGCKKQAEPPPAANPAAKPASPVAGQPAAQPAAAPAARQPAASAPAAAPSPVESLVATRTGSETTGSTVSQLSAAALAAVPLDDVKAEVAKLGVDQLKTKALEYKNAIVAKKTELADVTAKIKALSPTQLLSTDAKTLQSNYTTLTTTVKDLTARFQLYYDKIKSLGGSLAGLELPS